MKTLILRGDLIWKTDNSHLSRGHQSLLRSAAEWAFQTIFVLLCDAFAVWYEVRPTATTTYSRHRPAAGRLSAAYGLFLERKCNQQKYDYCTINARRIVSNLLVDWVIFWMFWGLSLACELYISVYECIIVALIIVLERVSLSWTAGPWPDSDFTKRFGLRPSDNNTDEKRKRKHPDGRGGTCIYRTTSEQTNFFPSRYVLLMSL